MSEFIFSVSVVLKNYKETYEYFQNYKLFSKGTTFILGNNCQKIFFQKLF